MVLPQLLDFLGVGNVLVRTDDHAVLLVHKLVHLGTYLLDGGLHLLAVDVDGYPAGAGLCHDVKFWQRCFKRPSQVRDGERLNLRILGVEFLYLFN